MAVVKLRIFLRALRRFLRKKRVLEAKRRWMLGVELSSTTSVKLFAWEEKQTVAYCI
jgi:hypothetical protein